MSRSILVVCPGLPQILWSEKKVIFQRDKKVFCVIVPLTILMKLREAMYMYIDLGRLIQLVEVGGASAPRSDRRLAT